jgi:hypothetical protein
LEKILSGTNPTSLYVVKREYPGSAWGAASTPLATIMGRTAWSLVCPLRKKFALLSFFTFLEGCVRCHTLDVRL